MLHQVVRSAAIAAFVAGTLLAPVAATAGEGVRANVSYADLNLASASGRATLTRRVARAADRVCGVSDTPGVNAPARRCAALARANAQPLIETARRSAADRQLAARDMSVTVTP